MPARRVSHPEGWAQQDTALKGSAAPGPGLSLGKTEAFPADPDFPQLAVASDPARMLEVFRTHLAPTPGRQVEIEDCIPFRFRYRQSTSRCVLQYTLRLRERTGEGGGSDERRCEQSVTGVVYAGDGEAERQWREGRAADPRREIPPQWLAFEPVAFIPALATLAGVFPYDRTLRP